MKRSSNNSEKRWFDRIVYVTGFLASIAGVLAILFGLDEANVIDLVPPPPPTATAIPLPPEVNFLIQEIRVIDTEDRGWLGGSEPDEIVINYGLEEIGNSTSVQNHISSGWSGTTRTGDRLSGVFEPLNLQITRGSSVRLTIQIIETDDDPAAVRRRQEACGGDDPWDCLFNLITEDIDNNRIVNLDPILSERELSEYLQASTISRVFRCCPSEARYEYEVFYQMHYQP